MPHMETTPRLGTRELRHVVNIFRAHCCNTVADKIAAINQQIGGTSVILTSISPRAELRLLVREYLESRGVIPVVG
jgi:hypothetical protein